MLEVMDFIVKFIWRGIVITVGLFVVYAFISSWIAQRHTRKARTNLNSMSENSANKYWNKN